MIELPHNQTVYTHVHTKNNKPTSLILSSTALCIPLSFVTLLAFANPPQIHWLCEVQEDSHRGRELTLLHGAT